MISTFDDLIQLLAQRRVRKRLAGVNGIDTHTQRAVEMALDEGLVDIIFVGGREIISHNQAMAHYHSHVSYIDADSRIDAAHKAVRLVRDGKADMLMKGRINTDDLLRAVLDKQEGMLAPGSVLTQITLAEIPGYDHMIMFTDAAVIPFPTQEQRMEQVKYVVKAWHIMGEDKPRVSLIHCSEKTDGRHFPYTEGYKNIIKAAREDVFGPCIIDGPLDITTSLSPEALQVKGLSSPLEGHADALIFPNIEVGNVFHKTLTFFAHARTASVLQGTLAPVVLPSRGDTTEAKFLSIALAAL
mgnify:CR=1 FL=1